MGRVRGGVGGVVGVVEGVEGLGRDVLSAVVRYGDAECDGRRQDKTWIQALTSHGKEIRRKTEYRRMEMLYLCHRHTIFIVNVNN